MFTPPDPKSPLFDMVRGIVNAQAALVRALPAEPAVTRLDFAPGHEDARPTSEQVAALMRKVRLAPRMLAALQWFEMLQERPGENSLQRFERVAEAFRRETGYVRPGKDCRLYSPEERLAVWDEWVRQRIGEVRAILAEAEGRSPQEQS